MNCLLPERLRSAGFFSSFPAVWTLLFALAFGLLSGRLGTLPPEAVADEARALLAAPQSQDAGDPELQLDADADDGVPNQPLLWAHFPIESAIAEPSTGGHFRFEGSARARAPPMPLSA